MFQLFPCPLLAKLCHLDIQSTLDRLGENSCGGPRTTSGGNQEVHKRNAILAKLAEDLHRGTSISDL
jgi:hypothetical protein